MAANIGFAVVVTSSGSAAFQVSAPITTAASLPSEMLSLG